MIKIKQKEIISKIFPKLFQGLSGKILLDNGMTIEIFGNAFAFNIGKEGDKIAITFTGQKPRLTVNKGFFAFTLDFQSRISKLIFNQNGGILELDGLPDQTFEFV